VAALIGQIAMTLTDIDGASAIGVSWFYDPATRALRNNPAPWTGPDGTTWPAGSGALIGANLLDHDVQVRVNDPDGNLVRRVKVPMGAHAVTAQQLSRARPPDGPYTTAQDFNGLTFDVS
jgi:hypothetical protein